MKSLEFHANKVNTLKIIDAHAHIFPKKIAERASKSIGKFYGIEMGYNGLVKTLLNNGKKIGVSKYLVCSSATRSGQVSEINDYVRSECDAHPEFIGFGTIHPDMPDPFSELERIAALGFYGIKLHPDFQEFYIDDEKLVPVFRRIERLNLPVLFHMGDERYDFSRPVRLFNLMQRVPGLFCIAAHFGGYKRWDEARRYLKDGNVYFDTSSTLAIVEKEYAKDLIEHFGARRFFFGVDYPMWDHEEELERFMALDLSDSEREMILYKNFERIFKVRA